MRNFFHFSFEMKDATKTIAIFHASKTANEDGELNWVEFKQVCDVDCKTLQSIIGGLLTLLPNVKEHPNLIAYADDEGLMKDLSRNDLAGGSLYYLGFRGSEYLGCAYAGTVVVTNINESKGLTDAQKNDIKIAIEKYGPGEE